MSDDALDDFPTLELVRKTHRTLEPIHSIVYFVPEAGAAYAAAGVEGAGGYFASRSAPMGVVHPAVVTATFFNFNPDMVAAAMQDVWASSTPDAMIAARLVAVDGAYRRLLGDEVVEGASMERAAALARAVAEEARNHLAGRPLFAGHATLDWPTEPHLVLWHAVTLLREFRGDAHVAALLTAGLDGLDALVVHAASGTIPVDFLKLTRGWSDEQWNEAVELHVETGWLTPEGVLSDAGVALREQIEIATDRGAAPPWSVIGAAGCQELRELTRPWARTLADALFADFGG